MYKNMKKIIILLIVSLFGAVGATAGETVTMLGRKSIGINAGYNSRGITGVAGVFFKYRFSRHFTLAPNIDYVFRHNNVDAYAFNINADFTIPVAQGRVNLYPLAGLNASSWNIRNDAAADSDDSSTRVSRLGVNVGGGVEVAVTRTLSLSLEAYYNYVKHYDGAYIKAAIGYNF